MAPSQDKNKVVTVNRKLKFRKAHQPRLRSSKCAAIRSISAREIVGVVGDVRQDDKLDKTPLQMYLPIEQNPISFASVVVRAAGDARARHRGG